MSVQLGGEEWGREAELVDEGDHDEDVDKKPDDSHPSADRD